MEKVLLAAMDSEESNDAREHTFGFHRTQQPLQAPRVVKGHFRPTMAAMGCYCSLV
jgi:hypothetical protein